MNGHEIGEFVKSLDAEIQKIQNARKKCKIQAFEQDGIMIIRVCDSKVVTKKFIFSLSGEHLLGGAA
jgi:hypothetical protein